MLVHRQNVFIVDRSMWRNRILLWDFAASFGDGLTRNAKVVMEGIGPVYGTTPHFLPCQHFR